MIIEDNGAGISPEGVKMLFKDFSRLEEHEETNIKGTGLGLSICKKLIQQMGGEVSVESVQNAGSKFIIKLNLKAKQTFDMDHEMQIEILK
jgi:signal transduction histidine kinase